MDAGSVYRQIVKLQWGELPFNYLGIALEGRIDSQSAANLAVCMVWPNGEELLYCQLCRMEHSEQFLQRLLAFEVPKEVDEKNAELKRLYAVDEQEVLDYNRRLAARFGLPQVFVQFDLDAAGNPLTTLWHAPSMPSVAALTLLQKYGRSGHTLTRMFSGFGPVYRG